ncbi:MAG: dockerin type I repeat-containing protein [Planctomycetes bacterium]|nr:dockerin type I repeat-containing protein [Planctomycetota bacterium]
MKVQLALSITVMITAPVLAQVCDPSDPQVSLFDLGTGTYKSFQGGLYAGGVNQRPAAHETAGVAIADSIGPLDINGLPFSNGRVVLISIGISNMTQEWRVGANNDPSSSALAFMAKAAPFQATGIINPAVLLVDGAKGAMGADLWAIEPPNLTVDPWLTALARLQFSQSSAAQVQIACIKAAHQGPTTCIASDGSTLGDAGLLAQHFAAIARNLKIVFPNIKLAYFVSRSYGGYATGGNREPFAYEQGFGVKWAIDAQISGSNTYGDLTWQGPGAVAPWLSLGPYIWANGNTPSGLGMTWDITDFVADHIHPSAGGVDKAATAFLDFFLTDTTTRPWFGWQCQHGDMDGNGTVDGRDISGFTAAVVAPGNAATIAKCRADINNDGLLDEADVSAMASLLLGGA